MIENLYFNIYLYHFTSILIFFSNFLVNSLFPYAGFKCRCDGLFCAKHRHALDHQCSFDFKTFDRDNLEKRNGEAVIAEKIKKL